MEDNRQVSNLRAEASKGDSDAVGLRMLEDAKTHLLPWMVRLGPEQPEKVMLPETPPRRPVLGGSGNLGPRSAMCFKASEVGASGAGALRRHQSQRSVPRLKSFFWQFLFWHRWRYWSVEGRKSTSDFGRHQTGLEL